MKIVKFRIKNYKSIKDSGDCYFSDKLTILAGKNESGKTTILEALEDFGNNKSIRESAVPLDVKNENPEITIYFSLSSDELETLYKKSGIPSKSSNQDIEIGLTKSYNDQLYTLTAETIEKLGYRFNWRNKYDLPPEAPEIQDNDSAESYVQKLINYKDTVIGDSAKNKKVDAVLAAINSHQQDFENITSICKTFADFYLPNFILFSSFEDSFPDKITIDELSSNEWASDLEAVSSFCTSSMTSNNSQTQFNHQSEVNAEFSDKFKNFWTQDDITLEVARNGSDVNFWIKEKGTAYKISQRSKGQQWYLSFFIKIVARIKDNIPNVILIDEPGLFLHARAQKDLLRVLEENTSDYPIVFSTHSPYLITENNLENIRLVEKQDKETKILGKIHAHQTADKETLTPILTAIGLGVNDSITDINRGMNIVVEGVEDVFYLQAFKEILDDARFKNVNFINGGGSGNIGIVGSIIEGWGGRVNYLLDNDQGGRNGRDNLFDTWKVLKDRVFYVTNQENTSIVDIFSIPDFKKYVLENESLRYSKTNSKYVKDNHKDKVLLARKFLQKVRRNEANVKLDEQTTNNIVNLLSKIIENET